jgi:prevent-host-death family protein
MISVGIKDLKNRLSYYLREVKKGEKILITERDQVIAAILPVERGEEDSRLLSLVKEGFGFATWKGGKPTGSRHPVKIKGKTVSEIVLEDRR